jgi:hypothetical protein
MVASLRGRAPSSRERPLVSQQRTSTGESVESCICANCLYHTGLLGILLNLEDGGAMFLRNVSPPSPGPQSQDTDLAKSMDIRTNYKRNAVMCMES